MAGRRPRLVQEGSPIVEVEGSEYPSADANNFHQHSSSNTTSLGAHQGVHTAIGSQVSGNAYKLKTSLVIGEGASDDLDDSMMDDDDYHQNVTSADHANSTYYGCHGSVYHGQALENQHYNPSHMAVDAMHHQHQAMQQHHPTQFFHNFQCNNNVSHIAPSHPTPTPIYHMPSPSISPLVVLDGANIAYSYSESINPISSSSSLRRQPDPRGIRLVIEYFLKHHCRVQAVVPTSWHQLKPRPGDTYHLKNRTRGDSDAKMITDEVEELRNLRQQGFLVAIPPGDDDDAYALALARREDDRLLEQQQHHHRSTSGMQQHKHEGMDVDDHLQPTLPLGGYVVSNDMFHDAIRRDENRQYQQQQYIHSIPLSARPVSLKSWLSKKRISYSFANVGTPSSDEADTNEIRLDFIPNPRNELIESIDACGRLHI